MADYGQERFVVKFRGELVECDSLEDAQALRSARDFLEDYMGSEPTPEDCDRLYGDEMPYHRVCSVDAPAFPAAEPTSDRPLSRMGA